MDDTIGPFEVNSKYFSNKSKTQRNAFLQYITSDICMIYEDLIHPPYPAYKKK